MELSDFTIRKLSILINGDTEQAPYLSGSQLVNLFNRFGTRDVYGEGFPSRWKYVEDTLHKLNGTQKIAGILETVVDPRNFLNSRYDVNSVVTLINELLVYDGYSLKPSGKGFKIFSVEGVAIEPESLKEIENDYVTNQINKCDEKILSEDYDGAITNARTLVETVIVNILKIHDPEYNHKGDLIKAYSRLKSVLSLDPGISVYPDSVKQLLSGLNSIVNGIATIRNEMSDAHAPKYTPEKHHAKLAVNSAKTLSEYLIDSVLKKRNNA